MNIEDLLKAVPEKLIILEECFNLNQTQMGITGKNRHYCDKVKGQAGYLYKIKRNVQKVTKMNLLEREQRSVLF